jgi:hypothetical protein
MFFATFRFMSWTESVQMLRFFGDLSWTRRKWGVGGRPGSGLQGHVQVWFICFLDLETGTTSADFICSDVAAEEWTHETYEQQKGRGEGLMNSLGRSSMECRSL